MLRLRAMKGLIAELVAFAAPTGSWWMLGIAILVVIVVAISAASTTVVPVAVYTFF